MFVISRNHLQSSKISRLMAKLHHNLDYYLVEQPFVRAIDAVKVLSLG